MHKPFYASGFIYHSPSQQILLQQFTDGKAEKFILFRGSSRNGEAPECVFKKCIEKAIGAAINDMSIHPVYDYVHETLGVHFVFFAEVSDELPKSYTSKNKTKWVSLSKVSKSSMSEQTRHDIIVGERVIRSLYETSHPQEFPRRH